MVASLGGDPNDSDSDNRSDDSGDESGALPDGLDRDAALLAANFAGRPRCRINLAAGVPWQLLHLGEFNTSSH